MQGDLEFIIEISNSMAKDEAISYLRAIKELKIEQLEKRISAQRQARKISRRLRDQINILDMEIEKREKNADG